MNATLRIAIFIALLIYFFVIFRLLKRKRLILQYSLLWLAVGLLMLLAAIFPSVLLHVLHLIGVVELTNGLFGILLFGIIVIMISITSIVSRQNEKLRSLIQKTAQYEKRIRELEDQQTRKNEE